MAYYAWLVHQIHDTALDLALNQYAHGILFDIGCGEKPYRSLTTDLVSHHFGLDHPGSFHSKSKVDIFGTAYETGVADQSIDTILCTVVLEHLERPHEAICEMYRILKPGGYIILSVPLFWHLHEEPRDFFRYTKYGLSHLFKKAGFQVVEINPLSGFIVTFSQELVYFLNYFHQGIFKYPVAGIQMVLQLLAYFLNRWDRSYSFTWAYLVVARKSFTESVMRE